MASRLLYPGKNKGLGPNQLKSRKILQTSFQQTAKNKLEKHPEYKDRGDNERETLARHLTQKDEILYKYFGSVFTDPARSSIQSKMEEEIPLLSASLSEYEKERAAQRARWRVEEVARLEVKLLLRHIDTPLSKLTRAGAKLLKLWYGPLHAALLINDKILVEWNTSSLVIPEEYMPGDMRYPLVTSVLHKDNQVDEPTDIRGEEIDLIFKATAQKQEILSGLLKVISTYNMMWHYNAVNKNCQHFVIDALREMGCENIPMFEGKMAEYYKKLEAGKGRIDFEDSHANLDQYVTGKILSVSDEDRLAISAQHKEYLLSQYFEFHIREMTNSPDPDQWQCSFGENCKMPDLEICKDEDARAEHQYLHKKSD